MDNMVDLKTLEKGDTVHFRCGGSAVVDGVSGNGMLLDLNGYGFKLAYDHSTGSYSPAGLSPLDIIRIEKPAFDWSKAKQGMAFLDMEGEIRYFVAHDFLSEKRVVVTNSKLCVSFSNHYKNELTRVPEHDLDIVKEGE